MGDWYLPTQLQRQALRSVYNIMKSRGFTASCLPGMRVMESDQVYYFSLDIPHKNNNVLRVKQPYPRDTQERFELGDKIELGITSSLAGYEIKTGGTYQITQMADGRLILSSEGGGGEFVLDLIRKLIFNHREKLRDIINSHNEKVAKCMEFEPVFTNLFENILK